MRREWSVAGVVPRHPSAQLTSNPYLSPFSPLFTDLLMPPTSTCFFLSRAAAVLAGLCLSITTLAQTTPTWVSARAVGRGAAYSASAVDAAGNTYEAGGFYGTTVVAGTTLTSQGDFDAYLAKYTPAGTLAWVRQIGSPGSDVAMDVVLDAAGNAYVSGLFTGSIVLGNGLSLNGGTSPFLKGFVLRYSTQGTPEWAQQTIAATSRFADSSGIGADANGNVYVTGIFSGTVTIGSTTAATPTNSVGVYLAVFSSATGALRSLVSAFHYAALTPGGSASYSSPRIAVSATGEAYLLNAFSARPIFSTITLTSRGSEDVLVAKYGAQGTFEWAQQLGGAASDNFGEGVVDAAGNLYVAANFVGPAIVGNTTLPGFGSNDGCLVKYSSQGTMLWAQASGGPGNDRWSSVGLDAAGNPYVTGAFSNAAQFGPVTLTSAGNTDIAVAAYTSQGQLRWAQRAGGPGSDAGGSIGLDAGNDVRLLGTFANTCAFGPLTLSTTAPSETFLARLGNGILATQAARPLPLGFFPNPATDQVQLPGTLAGTQVLLLDALGRVARTATLAADARVSVRGLAAGLYVVRASDAQGRPYTGRLMVE